MPIVGLLFLILMSVAHGQGGPSRPGPVVKPVDNSPAQLEAVPSGIAELKPSGNRNEPFREGVLPVTGARAGDVELLVQRRLAQQTRLALIASETRELRYNTFIFGLDDTGRNTLGGLVDAVRRGVKVKLIVDGYHLENLARNRHILQALTEIGVDVRVFNPVYRHPLSINNRNHMKSLIGTQEMVVGGRNTQNQYFSEYIDIEAHVRGSSVQDAIRHYDEVFNSPQVRAPIRTNNRVEVARARELLSGWARDFRSNLETPTRVLGTPTVVEEVRYVGDPADLATKRAAGINREIVAMIDRSRRTLEFMNPYVLMAPEVEEAVRRARSRGVRISVATNSSAATDSGLVGRAWQIKRQELIDMGVEVYETTQNYVHGKTVIRDGREVFIGSFNLDMRSFNLNLENGIFVRSRALARNLARHQARLRDTFMVRAVTPETPPARNILQRGGDCVRNGMNRLITSLVYPIL